MWLDPTPFTQKQVKLMGVASYGFVPCANGLIYSSVGYVVDWIKSVTGNCNKKTCAQDMCMTKDKLMPQALEELSAEKGREKRYHGGRNSGLTNSNTSDLFSLPMPNYDL